jgi:hypothetical protein
MCKPLLKSTVTQQGISPSESLLGWNVPESSSISMEFSTWLTSSHFVMLGMLLGFAIAHSGLAALRPWGEQRIGPRIYRIVLPW